MIEPRNPELRDAVERDIETALKRAADRARRDAQVAGVPLIRRENGRLIRIRIEADGSETIVNETSVSQ